MTADEADDWTGCGNLCKRYCGPDFCNHEHALASNMGNSGRFDASTEGIEFDSTGLPLEKGDCTT